MRAIVYHLITMYMVIFYVMPIKSTHESMSLSTFQHQSGSVLPLYTVNDTDYLLLSRERLGRDRGTYDDWGGQRDPGEDHPIITAAREFHEEAVIDKTIGMNLQQTCNYIDTYNNNTAYVIANTSDQGNRHVTYIVRFDEYMSLFINNFYTAVRKATAPENKEKDRLAVVKLSDLKYVVGGTLRNKGVFVPAQIIDPITGKYKTEKVVLRPYFVIKLRSFFTDQPYKEGEDARIRFYSPEITKEVGMENEGTVESDAMETSSDMDIADVADEPLMEGWIYLK
jgi:hypothetical protein